MFIVACGVTTDDSPARRRLRNHERQHQRGRAGQLHAADDKQGRRDLSRAFALAEGRAIDRQEPSSRGVCSIFAATAMVENLYLKAGMPADAVDFCEQYMQWSVKNQVGASQHRRQQHGEQPAAVTTFGTVQKP
jgi:hypothetical protein